MREPGMDKVSAATRIFEIEDAQMFRGAGRGPTPQEEAVADGIARPGPSIVDAYKEMIFRGACQRGEGRIDR